MGMHHLGHVYIPILTAYQLMPGPLDLYAIQWKWGPGKGGCHAFRHLVVCPCQSLACRSKSRVPAEKYGRRACL